MQLVMDARKSFLYVGMRCKRPLDLDARDESVLVLRAALLDFDNALDSIIYNRHVGGVQHVVFYDDSRALDRGSRSGRLRSDVLGVGHKSARNKQVSELVRSIRPVSGASLEMQCMPTGLDVINGARDRGVSIQSSCQGLFRRRVHVCIAGPVHDVAKLEQSLEEYVVQRYLTQFY